MYADAFPTLATPDLERLVLFYRAFLHQKPAVHLPTIYAEFHLASLRLALFQPKPDRQPEFAYPVGSALSICLEVASLEEAIAHLKTTYRTLSLTVAHPIVGAIITASHGREVYAYDPDGNRLILHQSHPSGDR